MDKYTPAFQHSAFISFDVFFSFDLIVEVVQVQFWMYELMIRNLWRLLASDINPCERCWSAYAFLSEQEVRLSGHL